MMIHLPRKRDAFVARFLLIALMIYLSTPMGMTFNGILNPDFQRWNLLLLFGLVILWLWSRRRGVWRWHKTPLTWLWGLWALSFVVSFVANPDVWRRSLIAIWYMGLYAGFWFVSHDCLANRRLNRVDWIDALLIAGGVIIGFGYIQVINQIGQNALFSTISRPVSLLGNANALGAYLVVIIPLAISRAISARRSLFRLGWVCYALFATALLLLTFSRGAWLGFLVAGSIQALLLAGDFSARASISLQMWLLDRLKTKYIIPIIGIGAIVVIILVMLLQSFTLSGRSADLRLPLWQNAIAQFSEKPVWGQGFFTYGRQLALDWPHPPQNAHSHAHNIPLNIAAELGLLGLFAWIVSVAAVLKVIRSRWHNRANDGVILAGGIAAIGGFATQHLVDIPMMMPAIAFLGCAVLIIVVAHPPAPLSDNPKWPIVISLLWIILLTTGWWSHHIYSQYISILQYAVRSQEYRKAAEALDSVIAADPYLAVYRMEQAFLWGMAATQEGASAAQRGIRAYNEFLRLEPYHAPSWANKAALHWQVGDIDEAIMAIKRALALSPNEPRFLRNLAIYEGEQAPPALTDTDLTRVDMIYGANWSLFQYLRQVYPRQFLPQAGYE